MNEDEFFDRLRQYDKEERERMEAEEEARYHAEMQLEHDLYQAARFLLAHETLGQAWARITNLAMEIDYGKRKEEEPF